MSVRWHACAAHKTRSQISNLVTKKLRAFGVGAEEKIFVWYIISRYLLKSHMGKYWVTDIQKYWLNTSEIYYFVPWILMMQSLNDPKKRRVLFSLHIYASQPKSWERVELDKFEFTLKFVRLRWVYFCPKSSKNRPFSAKIGHKMVFFMVLQMQHLLHPPPFKILTFCKSRRRVREFYCFLTAS